MQNYKLILCVTLTPVFQVIKLAANHVSMGFILSCSSRCETDNLKKSVLNNKAMYKSVFVQSHPESAVSENNMSSRSLTRSYRVIICMMMHQLELESLPTP